MSKRTPGERICLAYHGVISRELAKRIDRAISRAQGAAWDRCYVTICESDLVLCTDIKVRRDANPYRKAKKLPTTTSSTKTTPK